MGSRALGPIISASQCPAVPRQESAPPWARAVGTPSSACSYARDRAIPPDNQPRRLADGHRSPAQFTRSEIGCGDHRAGSEFLTQCWAWSEYLRQSRRPWSELLLHSRKNPDSGPVFVISFRPTTKGRGVLLGLKMAFRRAWSEYVPQSWSEYCVLKQHLS